MRAPPKTTRELYETHASQPGCNSCHNLIDQIAYPFENFDGAGRFRTLEQYKSPSLTAPIAAPQAIDPRGMLLGTDVDGEYDNHTEIARALTRSNWVRECVARQAFRFYFGQTEAARGIPPVMEGTAALAGAGTLRDLVIALFSSATTQQRARLQFGRAEDHSALSRRE